MNILYIYGLDSKLSREKRVILEKYGEVFIPNIDYYSDQLAIQSTLDQMKDKNIEVVIGSSMGGFAGFYISSILGVPALLFNPALEKRSVEQQVPEIGNTKLTRKKILLGAIDDVIDPGDTLSFISRYINEHTDFHLHVMPGLTHNIPVDIFKKEVKDFFGTFIEH